MQSNWLGLLILSAFLTGLFQCLRCGHRGLELFPSYRKNNTPVAGVSTVSMHISHLLFLWAFLGFCLDTKLYFSPLLYVGPRLPHPFLVISPLGLCPVLVSVCLSSLHFIWQFPYHLQNTSIPHWLCQCKGHRHIFEQLLLPVLQAVLQCHSPLHPFLRAATLLGSVLQRAIPITDSFLPWCSVCCHVPDVILASTKKDESGKAGGKAVLYFAEETAYCGTRLPASACRKVGHSFPLACADFAAQCWEPWVIKIKEKINLLS